MKLDSTKYYKAFAPRVTVLATTIDSKGNVNAAPFSFAMPLSMDPPLLALGLNPKNNTVANIKETQEFVVNIPSKEILEKVVACADKFEKGVNELKEVGLTEVKSTKIKPPRVKECLAWFECKLEFMKEAGDHLLVVGRVLEAEALDEYVKENGNLDTEKAQILMHVGGPEFATPLED